MPRCPLGGRRWPRGVGTVGRDLRNRLCGGDSRALATRALGSIIWECMARLLSGLNPVPPGDKSPSESRWSNLGPVVNAGRYGQSSGGMPAEPDGVSRARGINSFAHLPVHGGEFPQTWRSRSGTVCWV